MWTQQGNNETGGTLWGSSASLLSLFVLWGPTGAESTHLPQSLEPQSQYQCFHQRDMGLPSLASHSKQKIQPSVDLNLVW